MNCFHSSSWAVDFKFFATDTLPDGKIISSPSFNKCFFAFFEVSILFLIDFKSNCLKTGQPDWASVYIHYRGTKINHTSLLEYLISYRNHQGFHEQCVEQIFSDIFRYCYTQKLTVYARFTRRGGLDINPFRSNFQTPSENQRLFRQ